MLKGFHLQNNCTNSSAILVWQLFSQYKNSKTYVVIEWRTSYDDLGLWHRSPEKINAIVGTAEVKILPSWAKIQFRAIAQNRFGFGKPSVKTRFENCETSPARKSINIVSTTKVNKITSLFYLWLGQFLMNLIRHRHTLILRDLSTKGMRLC